MAISKIVYKSSASATPVVWMDATSCTATAADITAPKTAMLADGVVTTGTGSGGGSTSWETVYTGTVYCTADWGNGYYYNSGGIRNFTDDIEYGSEWRIIWDSTPYTCTATEFVDTGGLPYCLGNCTYDGGQSGTSYPFFMQKYNGDILYVVAEQGVYTVTIQKQVSTSWKTVYDGSLNLNRTDDGSYYYNFVDFTDYINQNSVWRVTWNNTEYSCTATSQGATTVDNNAIGYALGNDSLIGLSGGNNEPFFIQAYWNSAYTLIIVAQTAAIYSIKIEKQVTY